jgi:hypothetical protein
MLKIEVGGFDKHAPGGRAELFYQHGEFREQKKYSVLYFFLKRGCRKAIVGERVDSLSDAACRSGAGHRVFLAHSREIA